jgi:hypothetical protein
MAPAGGAVLAGLKDKLMYENLYYNSDKRATPGVKTDARTRPLILESLQHTLMQGSKGVKINSRRLVHELKTFKYNASKKRAEADKGKHDDAIMAMCLALYARDTIVRYVPAGYDGVEEMRESYKQKILDDIKNEWVFVEKNLIIKQFVYVIIN